MNQRKTLTKSLKWSSAGTIGTAIFQLLQITILTRFLPKEAFGLVALAVLVVNFTNIFVEMGFTSAILHVRRASTKEYSSLYWTGILIALGLYVAVFFLAETISKFYNEPQLVEIIRITGLNIIFVAIGQQHRVFLQKEMKFDFITKVNLFTSFVGFIAAIILVFLNYGLYSLVYSTLLSSFLSSVLFFALRISDFPIHFRLKFQESKKFLGIGLYSLGSNILDFLSRELDIIVIGKILSPSLLGVYSLLKQISLKLYSILMPMIFSVLNPFLASLNDQKNKMEKVFLNIVYAIVNITFPIYMIIILSSQELISVLYGDGYISYYKVLIYLLFFQACFAVVKPLGSLQIATGKTSVGFYWTILRNCMTVSLLLLMNYLGFNSLESISLGLAILAVALILLSWFLQVKWMSDIGFKVFLRQFYKPLLLMIGVIYLKIEFLDKYFLWASEFLLAFTKIVIGLIIYFLTLLIIDNKFIQNIKLISHGRKG